VHDQPVECVDDPTWTAPTGADCSAFRNVFTQHDCSAEPFAEALTLHCPVACGDCDHWLTAAAKDAIGATASVVSNSYLC